MVPIEIKGWINLSLVFMIMLVLLSACNEPRSNEDPDVQEHINNTSHSQGRTDTAPNDENSETEQLPPEPEVSFTEARLIAVGDIMMHLPQIQSGYDSATKTYNYDSFFTEVTPLLKGDWVIGNLETPLAGADLRYTGFPEFNAPPELADSLKLAGFNILTTANNHSLDRREKGVLRTLENLRSRGITPIGTAATQEEADHINIITHQDISMAILAYTYGTNGIPIPPEKPYLVSLIQEEKIVKDIHQARTLGADLVTIALHFGNEYQSNPTEEQQLFVHRLFKAGADIILGSHPHVLQPYQITDVITDDGIHKKGVVIYSMGNFISNQDRILNRNKPTDVGVIFEVGIRKQFPDLTVELTHVHAIPTYVHKRKVNGQTQYRVLPLESVLSQRNDELLTTEDYTKLESYYTEASTHLEAMVHSANVDKP